jgi:hypothetical protein
MEQILINLIAGALGGVGAGKASPTFDLGTVGNIISGLVGGGILGQIVTLLLPSVVAAAQSGNLSIGGIVSQVIAGGAGGAILTAIIGAIKNKVAAWRFQTRSLCAERYLSGGLTTGMRCVAAAMGGWSKILEADRRAISFMGLYNAVGRA